MSLSEDVRTASIKCKIKMLQDPVKEGKAWLREVMTQASIFQAKDTIITRWIAIESIDLTASERILSETAHKSTVPARGLGILPQVKIEAIEEEHEEGEKKGATTPDQKGKNKSVRTPRPPDASAKDLEFQELKDQIKSLKEMLLQQRLPDGFVTATRKEQITGTRGTREAWVAEAMILDAANRVKRWKHPETGLAETASQYRRRMIINVAIKESLKRYPEFYKNELEGDNYTIVRNVIMFGEPSSKFMKVTLDQKLSKLVKTKEKTYQEYEGELREIWDELACIGRHISDEDKTLKLIAGMENDPRYQQVVKEVCNSDSNYQQCHSAFMQEAHIKKDLWREQKKEQRIQGDVNSADQNRRGDRKNRNKANAKGGKGHERGNSQGRDRGRGNRGNRGKTKDDKRSRQNACPFYLAHGTCSFGDRCRHAHFSLAEFQSGGGNRRNTGKIEKKNAKREKNKGIGICHQYQNEGKCDRGERCWFRHVDEESADENMIEPGLQVGDIVQATNIPRKSVYRGLVGKITGFKKGRFQIKPITPIGQKDKLYLMNKGLRPDNLQGHKMGIDSIMSADRVTAYDYKAAFDPAADYTITPTEESLIKGSVKTLQEPIRLGGFQKGTSAVEFRKVGLLCIRSNTGMPGYMALPAYVSPMAKRTLVGQSQLDEMGWYLELGGGVARVRRQGSQANFLVLARFQETHEGLPVLNVTEEMKHGEQDLRKRLGESGGRKYPIPDELLVQDLANVGSIESPPSYESAIEGDICLAQRYSQQEKLDLMHQTLGHTNYMRLALMRHWDGDGPKPTPHVLAKACAVCAIAKAHARGPRPLSFEFKDDSILGHVYADLSTEMGTSIEGFKHFLSIFVQGATKFFAFYLRTRGEGNQWLMVWLRRAHTMHFPKKTKFLHIDNELNTNRIKQECLANGTQIMVNQRSAHEHNAKGERPIRTVTETMRATCLQGGAELEPYWPIGVQNAIEILDLLPPMRKLRPKKGKEGTRPLTPNELWNQIQYPSYKEQMRNIITPFCEVTAIADDLAVRGGKTHNPGIPALYLGPVSNNEISKRAHLVLRYDTGKRFTTRHVIPNSDRFPLIHGPSPGLKMHPAIPNSNKRREKGDKRADNLQPNLQEKGFDPDLHRIVEWEGEEADREALHEAVNEQLKQATGQVQVDLDQESENTLPDTAIDRENQGQQVNLAPENDQDSEKNPDGSETEREHDNETPGQDDTEDMPSPENDLEALPVAADMPELEPPIQEELTTALKKSHKDSGTNPFATFEPEESKAEEDGDIDTPIETPTLDQKENKESSESEELEAQKPTKPPIKKPNKALLKRKGEKSVTGKKPVTEEMKARKKQEQKPVASTTKRVTRSSVRDTGTYSKAFLARNPHQKFPPGTAVMTRWGPALVQRILANGTEAELIWPNYETPDAVYTTRLNHFWLPEERPDEEYDLTGKKIHGDVNLMENTDKNKFRGFDIYDLVGNVKARDINLSLPRHRHQIQHHVLRPLCEDAEAVELHGLLEKEAFGPPEKLPPRHRKIPVMWVYLAKDSEEDGSGNFKKMKARLTVRGDLEKQDVDKADAYSPVSHPVTYKILLVTHMMDKDVQFFVFDVEQAFLSTQHKRVVFVGHPPGYKIVKGRKSLYFKKMKMGEQIPTSVMRLLLALYGGKECSRLFWEEFRQWHINYGFKISHYEKCYLYLARKDEFIKIAFHVDDGMVAQKGKKLWERYLNDIRKRFTMKFEDLEKRTKFLGNNFHLNRERNYCLIEQSPSIEKMLQKFEMQDCNENVRSPFPTEWPTDKDLPQTKEEIQEAKRYDMRSAVGFLNWIEGGTKPELARPLKCAARYASNHGEKMQLMVKKMMRWCKRTIEYTMVLRGTSPDQAKIQIFTDASHATCPDTRRSITGVVIKLGGCTVFWKSLYQRIVSHSSTESELMALDKGATIGMHIRWLVELIGEKLITPVDIFVDNQSAITLASNPVHPDRNLHVHARYFYIRDLVEQGTYAIRYLKSADQLADLMCVFKSHEGFAYLYALVTNVAICVRTLVGDEIVYKWQITPKQDYITH